MDTFKPGDIILDRYEVTAVLGKGGMGVVLAAQDREFGQLVALKFLLGSHCDRPEVAARFIQEARTGRRINNPHVAQVFDVPTFNGAPFIVMEHLTGQDLAAKIREGGPLRVAEAADLLLQACEAVGAAHALGIVHRDLKPGNLFVTKAQDGTPLVKVLDFGISKLTDASDMSMTASAALLGSPQYMSPEQIESAKHVDARADVWALGVILYEMLTGVRPFTGDNVLAVYTAISLGEYRRPSEIRPIIPPELEQTIADALKNDRKARLPSVDAFAARLAPFATVAGRASCERVQRLASKSQPPSQPPSAQSDPKDPAPTSGGTDQTTTSPGTANTRAPLAVAERRPNRWRRATALGVLAAAASLAVVVPRLRQARVAVPDPATSASAPVAQAGPALPAPADSAAADEVKPTASVAPEVASAPARADDTPPTPRTGSAASSAGDQPARSVTSLTAGGTECAAGATAACEAACAASHPGSCLKLAEALEQGVGASKNITRAASLYQTACDGGSSKACNDLAVLYAVGNGVTKDASKAVGLYTKGCDGGLATACVNLGAMHFEGNGVPKDPSLGARFFLRGCEAGSAAGCLNVSVAYGSGSGVPQDGAQSVAFAQRACAGGAKAGCSSVELARIKGDGLPKDVKGGLAQLDRMCTGRDATACENLVALYAGGGGTDVSADPLRVREYTKKGCAIGSQKLCQADKMLGTMDHGDSTAARTNALFQTKCDGGDMVSCASLGEILVDGKGTSDERARGMALLKRACEGGVERACKKLGDVGTR